MRTAITILVVLAVLVAAIAALTETSYTGADCTGTATSVNVDTSCISAGGVSAQVSVNGNNVSACSYSATGCPSASQIGCGYFALNTCYSTVKYTAGSASTVAVSVAAIALVVAAML